MKFTHQIKFNSVPEWREHYINYAHLKKIVYAISKAEADESNQHVTFTYGDEEHAALLSGLGPHEKVEATEDSLRRCLDKELIQINAFYLHQEAEILASFDLLVLDIRSMEPRQLGTSFLGAKSLDVRTPQPVPLERQISTPEQKSIDAESASPAATGSAISYAARIDFWNRPPGHLAASRNAEKKRLRSTFSELYLSLNDLQEYLRINKEGFRKILKKHDKLLPSAPCWGFYKVHISSQPWVRGEHRDLQVTLARIFTELHGRYGQPEKPLERSTSIVGATTKTMLQNLEEHTRTFWVLKEDVPKVENVIMQRMPVENHTPEGAAFDADVDDWSVNNTLYLDNPSLELYHNLLFGRPYAAQVMLKWRGSGSPTTVQVQRKVHKEGWRPENSTKDSFTLREDRVSEFLNGRWTFDVAREYLIQQAKQLVDIMPPSSDSLGKKASIKRPFTRPNSMNSVYMQQQSQRQLDNAKNKMVQVEYNLFKTFTEVQRLVETKQLQPMILLRFRQTVFSSINEGIQEQDMDYNGAESSHTGLSIELDEDVTALLEFSYDGLHRIANGEWRQEQHADRIECPYALVKIHSTRADPDSLPEWIKSLMQTGMMIEVHDFSKYLYGASGLLPDMVRAVPVWIDDPQIQRALYINVLMRDLVEQGADMDDGSSIDPLSRAESSGVNVPDTHAAALSAGVKGWQAKLLQRQSTQGHCYKPRRNVLYYKDTSQFFGNERMFLAWLTMAISVGGVAVAVLGFSASASLDPEEPPAIYICEITALLLMVSAIFICAYSIVAFLRRSSKLTVQHPSRYDDSGGVAILNVITLLILFIIFCLNIADFIGVLQEDSDDDDGTDPPFPPWHPYMPPGMPGTPRLPGNPPPPPHIPLWPNNPPTSTQLPPSIIANFDLLRRLVMAEQQSSE